MNEYYATPPDLVQDLLALGVIPGDATILEPCAGDGAIIRTMKEWGHTGSFTAIELEPEFRASLTQSLALTNRGDGEDRLIIDSFFADYISEDYIGRHDVGIVNPPYSLTEKFIEKSLQICNEVWAVLRMSFFVGIKRCRWLRTFTPRRVLIAPRRPNFYPKKNTDICGTAWVLFDNGFNGVTTMEWLDYTPALVDYRSTFNRIGKEKK